MTRRKRFLTNALLLTSASLGMRGVGILFNLYLTARLGASGLGRFSLIMSVYGFAVTLASAGIGLAVTRVISEAAVCSRARVLIRRALGCGFFYSLLLGVVSMLLLFVLSDEIGTIWLHDESSAPVLRLLSVSLPFLSLSVTLNGYFVAVRRAAFGAAVNVFGQIVRIFVTIVLLYVWAAKDGTYTCLALALGCVMSELFGFLLSGVLFWLDYRRKKHQDESAAAADSLKDAPFPCDMRLNDTALYVIRIAVPIAITACIRAGLQTLLHLMIPAGLKRSGIGAEDALTVYGTVHGMVMPVLLFPSAILQSAASLLIPEIAEFRAKNDTASIERWANRILKATLSFALFTSGVILCCADTLGTLLYHSADAGHYLRLLGALIPVMYLDTMVDALLKGLNEQLASMRYNIIDASFCVAAAYFLLPLCGNIGYVLLLYASEILNLSLSLSRLLCVTRLNISFMGWVVRPLIAVIGAAAASILLMRVTHISFRFAGSGVFCIVMMMGILYCCFLRATTHPHEKIT